MSDSKPETQATCPFCNRSFYESRLEGHFKICTKEKPFKPLHNKSNAKPLSPSIKNKITALAQKKKIVSQPIYDEKEAFKDQVLLTCEKCDRKFSQDRIEKHQSICKGDYHPKKPEIKSIIEAFDESLDTAANPQEKTLEKNSSSLILPPSSHPSAILSPSCYPASNNDTCINVILPSSKNNNNNSADNLYMKNRKSLNTNNAPNPNHTVINQFSYTHNNFNSNVMASDVINNNSNNILCNNSKSIDFAAFSTENLLKFKEDMNLIEMNMEDNLKKIVSPASRLTEVASPIQTRSSFTKNMDKLSKSMVKDVVTPKSHALKKSNVGLDFGGKKKMFRTFKPKKMYEFNY